MVDHRQLPNARCMWSNNLRIYYCFSYVNVCTRPTSPTSGSRTNQRTYRHKDIKTDFFFRPSTPPNPELGFTTLGQTEYGQNVPERRILLTQLVQKPKNDSPHRTRSLTSDYILVSVKMGKKAKKQKVNEIH